MNYFVSVTRKYQVYYNNVPLVAYGNLYRDETIQEVECKPEETDAPRETKTPHNKRRRKPKYSEEEKALWRQARAEGMTYKKIAEIFDVKLSLVFTECQAVEVSRKSRRKKSLVQFSKAPDGSKRLWGKMTAENRKYKSLDEAERWLETYRYMRHEWVHSRADDKALHLKDIDEEIAYILELFRRKPSPQQRDK